MEIVDTVQQTFTNIQLKLFTQAEKNILALYGRRTVYTILKGKYKFCKQENIDFGINIPQKTHANIGIGKASRVLTVFEIMGGFVAYTVDIQKEEQQQ